MMNDVRRPDPADPAMAQDETAREVAVDPSRNVVLEASAGTGKTRILVTRYLNLLRQGVAPANVLAITFTRKAAAEMHERIVQELRAAAGRSARDAALWRELHGRLGEIGISTIDAFCLSLLHEFPLEADLDPGFEMADETALLPLLDETLDRTIRACRRLARRHEEVSLALASLGERRLRRALESLIGRRLVASVVLRRFASRGRPGLTASTARADLARHVRAAIERQDLSFDQFLASGPTAAPPFAVLSTDLVAFVSGADGPATGAMVRALSRYFLTQAGDPRKRLHQRFAKGDFESEAARRQHVAALVGAAVAVKAALGAYRRDLNAVLARGVNRMFRVARVHYLSALERHSVVDFTESLGRTLRLLSRMDEFAQSRYRLESRYHHVLVDEFQDTSRAQWRLVARLIESWGQGLGLASSGSLPPSIFIVGDRKQSIYGFRDADAGVLRAAGRRIGALRPDGEARRAIRRSFRSVPRLLAFTNDLFSEVEAAAARRDAFIYGPDDRFPVVASSEAGVDELGVVVAGSLSASAAAVADEIARLLGGTAVRDRQTGLRRDARPADIAILFRSRAGHREYERALESRGIPSYVYKGLGFFDADEVKDLFALVRLIANPGSDLAAAALLRSRFVRLSDRAIRTLAPALSAALAGADEPPAIGALEAEDRGVLQAVRASVASWLALADRIPPADLLDRVLAESAYAYETAGPRRIQASENVKKFRALVRRLQNAGYLTIGRLARHLDRLAVTDEGNATIDASDAVNLMTVHAAKGLEFPVVFLADLTKGTGQSPEPVLLARRGGGGRPVVSVADLLPDAREDQRLRDREETKRLLYVAVTRARDRLYLGVTLDKQRRVKPSRGSLAAVLPASFLSVWERAADGAGAPSVAWTARGGTTYDLRVCGTAVTPTPPTNPSVPGVSAPGDPLPPRAGTPSTLSPAGDRFGALPLVLEATRTSASTLAGHGTSSEPSDLESPAHERGEAGTVSDEAALLGTVVHRLFQRLGRPAADCDFVALREQAQWAARTDELLVAAEPDRLLDRAARLFAELASQPALVELLRGSTCLREVPFSLRPANGDVSTTVRGIIDCVVFEPGGRITVADFKTGAARPEDDRQVAVYVEAVCAMYPGRDVRGMIIRPAGLGNRRPDFGV